jgi:hypothetical protein
MSLPATTVSSIELVQTEIESTIHQAELSLERFQENRDSGEDLQNCLDYLNQLRGIFVLIEVQGCVLLCQESVALANEVPVGANDDKNALLTNLSNAIFILRRYTEYFSHQRVDHPELLLPIINDLRVARKAKAFPESHFFDFNPNVQFDATLLLGLGETSKLSDFEHHAKRFRHMYQVGLLDMLRDRNTEISLNLIGRAARGSLKLCAGEPLSQFWSLVVVVSETMIKEGLQITDLRKRLFMKIEKYLREMALVGSVVSGKAAPDSLRKNLLYLLALSRSDSADVKAILNGFAVKELDFDEHTLLAQSKRLFGPGADVLKSLSKALQEEIIQLKDKLDILERSGEPHEEDVDFICGVFERLSGTLSMLDLPNISKACDAQAQMVKAWNDQDKPASEKELFAVADAVLSIEQAVKLFEDTGAQPELNLQSGGNTNSESPFLFEAVIVVIDEVLSGLALAKRSITSYVESKGDKLHLENIGGVMDSIRGAMLMIERPRVAEIIVNCTDCINVELFENESLPEDRMLETLADSMTSLEYYIESMSYKETLNDELLKLSEESLKSISYG